MVLKPSTRDGWIGTNQTRTRRTERKTPGNGISKKLRASQRGCLRKELPKGAEAISSPHLPLGKSLKVNRWEAEPRDFNPFDPPLGGSYLQSSYKRIGSDTPDDTLYITETQEQMARTWKIPKPKLKFRPLVNFLTFTEHSKDVWKKSGINPPSEYYGITDYNSTMKRDYRWYDPKPPKHVDPEEFYRPEKKFRKLIFREDSYNNVNHQLAQQRSEVKPPYALDYEPETKIEPNISE